MRFPTLFASLGFTLVACAQLSPQSPVQARIGLRRAIEQGEAAGALHLAVQDGQTLYLGAVGYSDMAGRSPMALDSILRIYLARTCWGD
jgi:hypothetical protein